MNTISKFIFWIYEFIGKAWNVFSFLIPTKVNSAAIKPQNNWCFKKWGVAAKLPTTNLTRISSWNQDNMLSSAVFMWLPTSLLILFWLSCRSFWKKASPGLQQPACGAAILLCLHLSHLGEGVWLPVCGLWPWPWPGLAPPPAGHSDWGTAWTQDHPEFCAMHPSFCPACLMGTRASQAPEFRLSSSLSPGPEYCAPQARLLGPGVPWWC